MVEQKQKITATCRECGKGLHFVRIAWLHVGETPNHWADPDPATVVKDPPDPPTADERLARIVGMVDSDRWLQSAIKYAQSDKRNLVAYDHKQVLEKVVDLLSQIKSIAKGEADA